MVVDLALDNAMLHEVHVTVHEHLRTAVQALPKGVRAAVPLDRLAETIQDSGAPKQLLVALVVLVTGNEPIGDGIAQRADADLQGSPVANQAAHVEADHVILGTHRFLGGCEQREFVVGVVQDRVEVIRIHFRISVHIGKIAVHLGRDGHGTPFPFGPPHGGNQIQRHFRVAAVGIALPAVGPPFGAHQLRGHVDAVVHEIPHGVGVIGADIVELGMLVVHEGAGTEKEFADLDVLRHVVSPHRQGILQGRITAEDPLQNGLQETPLQIRRPPGHFRRDGRNDLEP
jgi:hypothetical protein